MQKKGKNGDMLKKSPWLFRKSKCLVFFSIVEEFAPEI